MIFIWLLFSAIFCISLSSSLNIGFMDFIQNECLISGKIFTMIFYEDVFFCHNQKKVSTLNLSFTRNSTPWFQFFGRPTIPFDDGVTTGSMSAVSVATSCPSHITGVAGLLCCTLGFEMDLFAFLTSLLFFFFCNDVVCRGLELLLQ